MVYKVSLYAAHIQCVEQLILLTFLHGENEEKGHGITTLLGNFKRGKVGVGGHLIASAMHFSRYWKKYSAD